MNKAVAVCIISMYNRVNCVRRRIYLEKIIKKRLDVAALGEILIDFTPGGLSESGSPQFQCNPGGAPANVLISVTRLGGSTAFIGKVGKDYFGDFLKATLDENKVNTDGLIIDPRYQTTLAFVTLDETGNRSFSFYRSPGADNMIEANEISPELIESSKIFHFGSLSLTNEPARAATHYALKLAKKSGCIISYDPNLRLSLWESEEIAREQIVSCLHYADILKISDEEFTFITGETDFRTHAPAFAEKYQISCLFITLGPKGAMYCFDGQCNLLPTYDVPVVDTTGSGDSFMGAVLSQICQREEGLNGLTCKELDSIVDLANASGSMAARKKGAIPAIPNLEQVQHCMEQYPLLK